MTWACSTTRSRRPRHLSHGGAFGLTPPITEAELKAEFLVDDPDLRFPYVGDYWTLSTIVEDLKFIFEQAELSGGDGRNVIVVGDSDGQIRVGGAIRNVQPWTGRATLDNGDNTKNTFPEYYIVAAVGGNSARISIRDSAGNDMLLVLGTNNPDRLTLNAQGNGPNRTGLITVGERDCRTAPTGVTRSSTAASSSSRSICSAAPTASSATTPR